MINSTKDEILKTGKAKILGSYSNLQLVQLADIFQIPESATLEFNISGAWTNSDSCEREYNPIDLYTPATIETTIFNDTISIRCDLDVSYNNQDFSIGIQCMSVDGFTPIHAETNRVEVDIESNGMIRVYGMCSYEDSKYITTKVTYQGVEFNFQFNLFVKV